MVGGSDGREALQVRGVRLEDRVKQWARDLGADERVRGERAQCHVSVASLCRLDGQLLVRLDRLDQATLLGRERSEREWMRTVPIDDRGDLDDGRPRQVGEGAAVPDVDDLDVATTVVQRRDQLSRSLA